MRSDKQILIDLASKVIFDVLSEGDISHANDDWADECSIDNLVHLDDHCKNICVPLDSTLEEDIKHIICRAAMLYYSWLKENGKIK